MKYFSYGMNTNLYEMAHRCPTAVCLGVAWINNYEFVFRRHADIQLQPGAICYGVLWEIDDACLHSLDRLEGFPHYYNRFDVPVEHNGTTVDAMVYQMIDQTTMESPNSYYLDMVTEGYRENGVPPKQIDEAINMVCYMLTPAITEYPCTWLPTIKDYV